MMTREEMPAPVRVVPAAGMAMGSMAGKTALQDGGLAVLGAGVARRR